MAARVRDVPQHRMPSGLNGGDMIGVGIGQQSPTAPSSDATGGAMVDEQKISTVGGSEELGSKPGRVAMDPQLYQAAVKGDVDSLMQILQKDFQLNGPSVLQGVSFGDNTVLHIAAMSSSDLRSHHYLPFADEVYQRRNCLLMKHNKLKETALHCAAKVGSYGMVCLLTSFAEYERQVGALLTATNIHGETALHEAVRAGHTAIVNKLIISEPRLMSMVDAEGVSPLYLATMTNAIEIVQIFTREKPSVVSCAGNIGQSALHAAVLEHTGITSELLLWDESLSIRVDNLGSTPLHYAASVGNLATVKILLQSNTSAAYMADKEGLFPVHIAAICGQTSVIKELVEHYPDSDELLDKEGRNFLHVAIKSKTTHIIFGIHENPTFLRMLNARDNQGNTPLHLAGRNGEYQIVRFLVSMKMVYSSIMNRDGLTPVDLAMKEVDHRQAFTLGTQFNILRCLTWTGALPSPRRLDHLENDLKLLKYNQEKEVQKAESRIRYLGLTSVLLATVTFAASFTMPGGYISDDQVGSGTPILSKKYAFKAFIMSDLLAFILSSFATSWLIYAGSSHVEFEFRVKLLYLSFVCIRFAFKATVCAFALAIYTVLWKENLPISILICVATFGLLPFSNPAYLWGMFFLASPLVKRLGFIGLFKPHFLPPTQKRVKRSLGFSYAFQVFGRIIENLALCIVIFLLALM